jgi:HK97 family phage major capsid protein
MARLLEQRADVRKDIDTLTATVEERAAVPGGDTHLTEPEAAVMERADKLAQDLDAQIQSLAVREEREAKAAALALKVMESAGADPKLEQRVGDQKLEQRSGGAQVRTEPTVYGERSKNSWVLDTLLNAQGLSGFGGLNTYTNRDEAAERLQRYRKEMEVEEREVPLHSTLLQRDNITTDFASLVPPQFLLTEYAALLRAGRPTANLVGGMGLPGIGMVLTIPRATAGTTVSTQATQGTNPTTTNMTVTDLSIPVNGFTGRAVLSRQAVERGGVDLDRITFQDLAADAARYMDQQVLFGSGASGNALGMINTGGIVSVAITATTGLDLIKAIANATQSINTQRFLPPDVIVMHPRRWGALTIAVDTTNRPLITVESDHLNVFGQGQADLVQQTVGTVLGIPVVTDPNLRTNLGAGTNQDEVLVFRRGDSYLWENGVREFVFEQPVGPAQIQLAVYGNHAFTAGRYPTAVAYISGVGLVPPTF